MQDWRITSAAIVSPDNRAGFEVYLRCLRQRRMRVFIEVRIGQKSERRFVRVDFEQVPTWIRLRRHLRPPYISV